VKQRILFTIDVEDYYMSPESIPISDWDLGKYPDRLAVGMEKLLDLLAEYDIQATFFWLGWLAERHPDLVKRCHNEGHEIGTHTYDHIPIYDLPVRAFRESLKRSIGVLSDLIGQPILSHRAPVWSLRRQARWMWDELSNAGIRVDSSIYPIESYLFGDATSPRHPYWIEAGEGGPILEVPPGTVMWFGRRAPLGGGGYLRALPWWYLSSSLGRWQREPKESVSGLSESAKYKGEAVIYIHPWELDPEHPDLPLTGREKRVHWVGLGTTERKLRKLLGKIESLSFREAFGLV